MRRESRLGGGRAACQQEGRHVIDTIDCVVPIVSVMIASYCILSIIIIVPGLMNILSCHWESLFDLTVLMDNTLMTYGNNGRQSTNKSGAENSVRAVRAEQVRGGGGVCAEKGAELCMWESPEGTCWKTLHENHNQNTRGKTHAVHSLAVIMNIHIT